MEMALEAERPIRTRSDLAEIPIIGRFFQAYCDVSDFFSFNAGLAKDYLPLVPVVASVPSMYVLFSTVRRAFSIPTMLVAATSIIRT